MPPTTTPSADLAVGLPAGRGPISRMLLTALWAAPHELPRITVPLAPDPLADEDLQLALYCCYELHYRGLPGVDDRWEWNPSLLELRAQLEARMDRGVAALVAAGASAEEDGSTPIDATLRALVESDEAPSLSRYLDREGDLDQLREFLVHRSAYQLKEADPHSWAMPRLSGRPKAALIEIQADEYGNGRADRIHAALFADAMDAFGLDARYGAHLDRLPALTLATVNLMSAFGLHRRRRGAIVGHLAAFEMTSSLPNRRYGDAARRVGPDDPRATAFFDEHVTPDAVHESIAAVDLAGGLAEAEPDLAADILFGARAMLAVEGRWARMLLDAWNAGHTALLTPGATVEVLP